MRFDETDTSVTTIVVPEALSFTAGERYKSALTSWTYTQATVEFSRRYLLDAYYAYDFIQARQAAVELRFTRIVHKWAFELSWGIDFGEGGNQSISINVSPVELLQDMRRRREQGVVRDR